MGDLLGSLIWGAKSGQYCVIGGGSLHTSLAQPPISFFFFFFKFICIYIYIYIYIYSYIFLLRVTCVVILLGQT